MWHSEALVGKMPLYIIVHFAAKNRNLFVFETIDEIWVSVYLGRLNIGSEYID